MSSSRRPAGLPLAAGSSRKHQRESSSPDHNLAQPQKRATADRCPSSSPGHDQSSSSPLDVLSRSPSAPSDDETAPTVLAPATAPATTAPAPAAAGPATPPGPGSVLHGISYHSNQVASPLHRHRSSLEGVILPATQFMKPEEQNQATSIFHDIVRHFEPSQTVKDVYKPITLITLFENEISEKSDFLRRFFRYIGEKLFPKEGEGETDLEHVLSCLKDFASWDDDKTNALNESLAAFAEFLINNFFLPLKSSAAKTPQLTATPASRAMLSDTAIGTPHRLRNLRQACLVRDRHRCAITRKFDFGEAKERLKREKDNMKDDDGQLLLPERDTFAHLEVAHIIPHSLLSLTNEEGERKLAESKQIAHMFLKMFNPTAIKLINGSEIDRPVNALSMTLDLHRLFGNFEISFEQIGPPGLHTYKVDYLEQVYRLNVERLPVTVTLPLTPDRSIDPPSPELLAIHRAIGRILHLSAAGDYIDKFLQDMEEMEGVEVMANGSTRLEDYVLFRLAGTGWLDETSAVKQHWRKVAPVTDLGDSTPAM